MRSDPYFYAILGVIGATYVVLIVAMLLADAAYIFTSDMSERIVLDLSTDGDGGQLRAGDTITDQFVKYGLTISTHDPSSHPARIVDSNTPSAANSNLGTPNQDFGGPGVGYGGRRNQTDENDVSSAAERIGKNDMPLGKVLVVADCLASDDPSDELAQFVVNWVSPVQVRRVRIENSPSGGGEIVAWGRDGTVINRYTVGEPGADDGASVVEIDDEEVSRMDVTLPSDAARAAVEYSLDGVMNADLHAVGRETVRTGSVRVVPKESSQIAPTDEPASLIFNWQDPIRLDEVQLLDINVDDATIRTYDINGESLSTWDVEQLGPNSVQSIEVGEGQVARMEVNLPHGGAVAELKFTWSRRVRTAWERETPALSRLIYNPVTDALQKPEIQYSIRLTLISCTITTIVSLWVAVPIGYLMSRHDFFGRNFIDAVMDIPIVLPPLVVGLSLLILFQFVPVELRELVVYQIPGVVLAQFAVACAFAVRTMRATFDHIDARHEQVALTLGCARAQAFGMVVLPEAKRGMLTAGTLAWARSLGEFGPLLIFAGTTRFKTEVLSTTVFLEMNNGDLGAAVAVSLIMVAAAVMVLVLARAWGTRNLAI